MGPVRAATGNDTCFDVTGFRGKAGRPTVDLGSESGAALAAYQRANPRANPMAAAGHYSGFRAEWAQLFCLRWRGSRVAGFLPRGLNESSAPHASGPFSVSQIESRWMASR